MPFWATLITRSRVWGLLLLLDTPIPARRGSTLFGKNHCRRAKQTQQARFDCWRFQCPTRRGVHALPLKAYEYLQEGRFTSRWEPFAIYISCQQTQHGDWLHLFIWSSTKDQTHLSLYKTCSRRVRSRTNRSMVGNKIGVLDKKKVKKLPKNLHRPNKVSIFALASVKEAKR